MVMIARCSISLLSRCSPAWTASQNAPDTPASPRSLRRTSLLSLKGIGGFAGSLVATYGSMASYSVVRGNRMAESSVFEKFSISLPPELSRIIHERVHSGQYGSASEVFREAMRALLARERRLAALDAAITKGVSELDAGLGEEAETVRREIQARLRTPPLKGS